MQNKFQSLAKFIQLSEEESRTVLGGETYDPAGPTKIQTRLSTSFTYGGKTTTIIDLDTNYDQR